MIVALTGCGTPSDERRATANSTIVAPSSEMVSTTTSAATTTTATPTTRPACPNVEGVDQSNFLSIVDVALKISDVTRQLNQVATQLWPDPRCPQPFKQMGDQSVSGDCFNYGPVCLYNNDVAPYVSLRFANNVDERDLSTVVLAVSFAITNVATDAERIRDTTTWAADSQASCRTPVLKGVGVSGGRGSGEILIVRC